MVIRLPAMPVRPKPEVNVVVVLAGKMTVAGCVVLPILAKVFAPVIVSVPTPAWRSVQLNVEPPPTKVLAVAAVIEMKPVPVPAVVVKLIGAALLKAVVDAVGHTRVPALNVRFLVPAAVV